MKQYWKRLLACTLCCISLLTLAVPALAIDGCIVDTVLTALPAEETLAALYPDTFGGLYEDQQSGNVHIVIIGKSSTQREKTIASLEERYLSDWSGGYAYVWRPRGYPLQELRQLAHTIAERIPAHPELEILDVSVNVVNNQVMVGMKNFSETKVRAFKRNIADHPALSFVSVEYPMAETITPLMEPTLEAVRNTPIRRGPNAGYKKIGTLKKGESMIVTESAGNDRWAKVEYLGGSGYVLWEDVRMLRGNKDALTHQVPKSDQGNYGDVCTTANVNVRSGPGTGYEKLGQLKKGSYVAVWEIDGDWAKITFPEAIDCMAHVHRSYLNMIDHPQLNKR